MKTYVSFPELVWFQEGPGVRNTQYRTTGIKLLNVSNLVDGKIDLSTTNRYISSEEAYNKYKHFLVDEGDFIIASSGIKVEYFEKKMGFVKEEHLPLCMNTSTIRFKVKNVNVLNIKYFMYFLKSEKFKQQLAREITGSAQLNFGPSHLKKMLLPLITLEKQEKIINILELINNLIDKRQQQVKKLDELVKSRFIEMFGDPVKNPYEFKKVALSELADIKIGPFGSLLHKEDYISDGHPILNPSHIVNGKIIPDNHLTISDEKYNELEAYHLNIGDVIMGRRGEMGRCAVITSKGFLCGTGSLLIRSKGEITADYLQKTISFPSFKKTIEDLAVGQTMPNLNVPIVSRFQIIKPPIDVQNNYYTFVEQTNKSKLEIQKSLDKLELLKKSLMQQYFG